MTVTLFTYTMLQYIYVLYIYIFFIIASFVLSQLIQNIEILLADEYLLIRILTMLYIMPFLLLNNYCA